MCRCDVAVRSPPASAAPSPGEGLRICSFASSPFHPTANMHGSKSCWGLSWGHQCRWLVMPHSTVHVHWSRLLARVAKILHKEGKYTQQRTREHFISSQLLICSVQRKI